jgi:hypothetical protein
MEFCFVHGWKKRINESLYSGDNKDLQQLHNLGYPMHVTESQYFLFMEVT